MPHFRRRRLLPKYRQIRRAGGQNGVIRPIVGARFRRYDGRAGNPHFAMQKRVAAFALCLFCLRPWSHRIRTCGDSGHVPTDCRRRTATRLGLGEGGSVTIRHGAVPFLSCPRRLRGHPITGGVSHRQGGWCYPRTGNAWGEWVHLGCHQWEPDGIPFRPVDTAIPDAAGLAPDRGGAGGQPRDRLVLHRAARIRSSQRGVERVQESGQHTFGRLHGDDGARSGFLDLRRSGAGPIAGCGARARRNGPRYPARAPA